MYPITTALEGCELNDTILNNYTCSFLCRVIQIQNSNYIKLENVRNAVFKK